MVFYDAFDRKAASEDPAEYAPSQMKRSSWAIQASWSAAHLECELLAQAGCRDAGSRQLEEGLIARSKALRHAVPYLALRLTGSALLNNNQDKMANKESHKHCNYNQDLQPSEPLAEALLVVDSAELVDRVRGCRV